jgi:hypothetical protein
MVNPQPTTAVVRQLQAEAALSARVCWLCSNSQPDYLGDPILGMLLFA